MRRAYSVKTYDLLHALLISYHNSVNTKLTFWNARHKKKISTKFKIQNSNSGSVQKKKHQRWLPKLNDRQEMRRVKVRRLTKKKNNTKFKIYSETPLSMGDEGSLWSLLLKGILHRKGTVVHGIHKINNDNYNS